ncbi:MAG: type II toxin-antitoxin system RelE/ParE family toxin [Pyrinomonadaceae bacterium]
MSRFNVEYSEEAIADLDSSFEWGCERWGAIEAENWYIEVRDSVSKMLGSFPFSQPLAPEAEEYKVEVRQMIIGRYCIIFNVEGNVVTILQVRGPYTGK